MSVKIRLSRGGTKKKPFYSIVVADSRSPRDGRFLEKVGTYDPRLASDNPARIKIKEERVRDWLGRGAQPSDRVEDLLDRLGVLKKTLRFNPRRAVPGKKSQERQAREDASSDQASAS